jgi:hypothetical protein
VSLPARFLTGRVALERRTSTDHHSGNTYSPTEVVSARWFDEERVVRTHDAREVVSTSRVSVTEAISVGDRVSPAVALTVDSSAVLASSGRVTAGATLGPDPSGHSREVVVVRRNEDVRGGFSHFVGFLR